MVASGELGVALAYSPVAPENGEHGRYGRDCMRSHGHEDSRIPRSEVERRRVRRNCHGSRNVHPTVHAAAADSTPANVTPSSGTQATVPNPRWTGHSSRQHPPPPDQPPPTDHELPP